MADETNLTPEEMAARITELEGRVAKGSSLSFKVSEKGAVSVYGLGRFPVTLYLEQWDALLSHSKASAPVRATIRLAAASRRGVAHPSGLQLRSGHIRALLVGG